MGKRNSEPRFLPCVSTHYRNVMKTKFRQFTDIRQCIVETYNGGLEPELVQELDSLILQTVKVFEILNSKSSKPITLEE